MDPATLSIILGLCTRLANSLGTLIKKSRNVDNALGTLHSEIKSLASVIASISNDLKDPFVSDTMLLSSHLRDIRQSLEYCLMDLKRLDQVIESVEKCEGRFLLLKKPIRLDCRNILIDSTV
jgi:ABC-type transporter Mla subunit MlaD